MEENNNIIKIEVSEEVRDKLQKAHLEMDSTRDILIYLMTHEEIKVSEEKIKEYKKEYEDRYFNFEQCKNWLEQNYITPVVQNTNYTWSLDYTSCIVTVQLL